MQTLENPDSVDISAILLAALPSNWKSTSKELAEQLINGSRDYLESIEWEAKNFASLIRCAQGILESVGWRSVSDRQMREWKRTDLGDMGKPLVDPRSKEIKGRCYGPGDLAEILWRGFYAQFAFGRLSYLQDKSRRLLNDDQ